MRSGRSEERRVGKECRCGGDAWAGKTQRIGVKSRVAVRQRMVDVGEFLDCLHARHLVFFFQAEDGIRDTSVTGVQTCALPIWSPCPSWRAFPRFAATRGWVMTPRIARCVRPFTRAQT